MTTRAESEDVGGQATAYREDRWWAILEAVGACLRVARFTRWPSTITVEVARSTVNPDYWPVGIHVEATFHAVVSHGQVVGRDESDGGATVTVHRQPGAADVASKGSE